MRRSPSRRRCSRPPPPARSPPSRATPPMRGPEPRPPGRDPRRWHSARPARASWCRRRAEVVWGRRTGSTVRHPAQPRRHRHPSGGDRGDVLLGLRLELALARRAAEVVVSPTIPGDVPGGRHLDGHAADGVYGFLRSGGGLRGGLFPEAGAELRPQSDDLGHDGERDLLLPARPYGETRRRAHHLQRLLAKAPRPQIREYAPGPPFAGDEPHVGEVQPHPGLDCVLVELPEGGDDQPGIAWMGDRLGVQLRRRIYGEEPEAQRLRYSGQRACKRRVARGGERGAGQERLDVEVRRTLAGAGHAGHPDVVLNHGGVRCDSDEPGLAILEGGEPFPAGGWLYAPAAHPSLHVPVREDDGPVARAGGGGRLGADHRDDGEGTLHLRELARPSQRLGAAGEGVVSWVIHLEGLHPVLTEDAPDLGGRQRHVHVPHAVGRERVHHGVDDRGGRADRRRLGDAPGAERVVGRRCDCLACLPLLRDLHRSGDEVVHEVAVEVVAFLVEFDDLHERGAYALCQAAVDLALHDHRVDADAAIVHRDEAFDLYLSRALVYLHYADVRAEGVGHLGWVVVGHALEPGLFVRRRIGVRRECDLTHLLALARGALHLEAAVYPLQVALGGLQQVSRYLLRLLPDLAGDDGRGGPADGRAPAAVGAKAVRRVIRVPVMDVHVLRGDPQLAGDDLGEGGLVSLSLALHPDLQDGLTRRVDTQFGAVEHLEAGYVALLLGTRAHDLGEGRDADAHDPALLASLFLLLQERRVVGDPERLIQGCVVVTPVVGPAHHRFVGLLLRGDEVLAAQLDRVHAELVGQDVHRPLHEVDGFGDPERAAVGDPSWRLVRVDARGLGVGRRGIVTTGEDGEEAHGPDVPGLRVRVEGAVVGENVDADAEDVSVLVRRDLADHVVVAGEAGANQILRARLHPLDGPAEHERGDGRAHVAGIDGHLVTEPAADVGGDYPDLLLREACDYGRERPVGVRRLGGHPERHLLCAHVVVRYGPARLHRRRVDAGVDHLLLYGDVGLLEGALRRLPVPVIPLEDHVVRLLGLVVPDDRGIRIEGPRGLDDDRERLVVDLDQLERVLGRVPIVGYDEGDLLALEAHLVGGEDRLGIARDGGHPGEALLLQVLPRDDGANLRVIQGGGDVDAVYPGVGERAPQDRRVQHPRQLQVVHVLAPAADEAPVLLAGHPVAEGVSLSALDGHYGITSTCVGAPCLAAHSIDLMMYW